MLLGLMLWVMPAGDSWIHASFDYQLRFGSRPVTNKIALILMDNAAFDEFGQQRSQPWDRGLHAQLLNRLADDNCAMVVFGDCSHLKATPHVHLAGKGLRHQYDSQRLTR